MSSAAGGAGSDKTQDGGYGFGGEVVRHALPEKYAALRRIEARLAQNVFERLAIKINLHEGQVGRFAFDEFGQLRALRGEGFGVINFKNCGGAKLRNAKCAAIESGAEDDDLADAFRQSGDQCIVNPARAGDSGGARAGDDHVSQPRDRSTEHRDGREAQSSAEWRAEETGGIRIAEQALARWPLRFQGAKERHVFGGAAGVVHCTPLSGGS